MATSHCQDKQAQVVADAVCQIIDRRAQLERQANG